MKTYYFLSILWDCKYCVQFISWLYKKKQKNKKNHQTPIGLNYPNLSIFYTPIVVNFIYTCTSVTWKLAYLSHFRYQHVLNPSHNTNVFFFSITVHFKKNLIWYTSGKLLKNVYQYHKLEVLFVIYSVTNCPIKQFFKTRMLQCMFFFLLG